MVADIKRLPFSKSPWLLFQKWQDFGEFWPGHSKVSKISTLIGSFCAKYITFDLKSTAELSYTILKSDTKFEEKLTCGLENEFSSEHLKVSKLGIWWDSFCPN